MKKLCQLGIIKEGFFLYSIPVMLISRKVTKDERAVTDTEYLNVRNARNNLVYPLLKEIFSMLGSSTCKLLPVPHLKDEFYSSRLSENSKEIVEFTIF